MSLTFLLVILVGSVGGLRFYSPPRLASFGNIYHTTNVQQAQIGFPTSAKLLGNYSVFIPSDYIGCNPIPLPPSTAVWTIMPAPCPQYLGQSSISRAFEWKQQGAEAVIASVSDGLNADNFATGYTVFDYVALGDLPLVSFKYLGNWSVPLNSPSNPDVGRLQFFFLPGFNNITATLGAVNPGLIYREYLRAGSPLNGVLWTTWSMCLIVTILCVFKLSRYDTVISSSTFFTRP